MRAGIWRGAWAALALGLGMALWLGALAAQALGGSAVEMRYDQGDIDENALAVALSASDPVRAASYGVSAWRDGQVAWGAGDLGLLAGDDVLHGHLNLQAGECALSLDAARALLGADDVLGRVVDVAGQEMVVRGVYRHGQGDAIAPWRQGLEVKRNCLMVASPDWPPGDSLRRAQAFGERLGLGKPGQALDMPLLGQLAHILAVLPGWALALAVIVWQLKAMGRGHRLIRLAALALSIWAMAWALGVAAPPAHLLPTRWSDFAFWRQLAQGIGRRVGDTLAARHGGLDRARTGGLWRSALMGLTAAHLMAAGFKALTKGRPDRV